VDKPKGESQAGITVCIMRMVDTEKEIESFRLRLRAVREGKRLTLLDVEKSSGGHITAVALGSYERGDRNVALQKLLEIACIYNIPASQLLVDSVEHIEPGRITVDLRKLVSNQPLKSAALVNVFKSIAAQRGDWNGEVLSIRASDISNLHMFSGLTSKEIQCFISECTVPRSK
jgi:transcriptional regulator with XRE-family HTH domain